MSLSQSQQTGTLVIFVNPVRISLVSPKRILIFKISATQVASHLLLDATVEAQNVSFGVRSLGKHFPTNGTLRFATSLPKHNELLSHKAFKIIHIKFGKGDHTPPHTTSQN